MVVEITAKKGDYSKKYLLKNNNNFGESKIEETAKNYDIDIVAKIPIDPEFALLCDKGDIEKFNGEHLNAVLDKIFSL